MNENTKTTSVTIMVLPDSSMMSLASIVDPLRAANRLSRLTLFSWKIMSIDGRPVTLTSGIEIQADIALGDTDSGDLLFILAGFNHEKHVPKVKLTRIRKLAQRFNTVCAIESGTWVLARAGVLNSHRVTTHWEDLENIAFRYPNLEVVAERFVIDGNIWSSGGASPSLDMLLHYLRTTQHQSLAMDVANVFIYSENKVPSDVQPSTSLDRLKRIEPRLATALSMMEQHIETPLSIAQLASSISMSVRGFELIYKKHLGISPGAHYLRLRLQASRRLVSDSNASMQDIAVRSGFNSQAAFNRAFKKRFGFSPGYLRSH